MTESPAPAPAPSETPAPSPSPAPAPAAGGDPWYAAFNLPDDQRQYIAGKGLGGVGDVVKNAMDFERIARERNVIVAPDADPAKRDQWEGWAKLGWEADRAKYTVEPVKIPEGKNYDAALEKAFLDAAHKARAPLPIAKAILGEIADYGFKLQDEALTKGAHELANAQGALRVKWGADFAVNEQRARQAAQVLGATPAVASQLEKALGGAPALMEFFADLGARLGEDTLKGGAAGGGAGHGLTPDGAAAEQNRLAADATFMAALRDPSNPQHAAHKARWEQLQQIKFGGK